MSREEKTVVGTTMLKGWILCLNPGKAYTFMFNLVNSIRYKFMIYTLFHIMLQSQQIFFKQSIVMLRLIH